MPRATTILTALLLAACASSNGDEPRFARGNVLTSHHLPPIQITLSPAFRYVGKFPFTIGQIAEGERYVFVDAEGKRVRRMFVAQFESFIPSSGEVYRYDFSKAMEWNGYKFRDNTFAFNDAEEARVNPKKEGALTRAFLLERGYEMPEEWMISRFVTLGDESRLHELILFYAEDLRAVTGKTVADMYRGEEPTPEWQKARAELRERSLKEVSVRRPPV